MIIPDKKKPAAGGLFKILPFYFSKIIFLRALKSPAFKR